MDRRSVPDLIEALTPLTGDEAFRTLTRRVVAVEWSQVTSGATVLADGSTIRFDGHRRSATIARSDGGTMVIDLGRPDRLRPATAILTPDLSRVAGPHVVLTPGTPGSPRGSVALREPGAPGAFGLDSLPVGVQPTGRYVDGAGRLALVTLGPLDAIADFGTFLLSDGGGYARLRTRSGLGCLYDARRKSFPRLVGEDVVDQARSEGIAQVQLKGETVGIVFDCGAPGDYLGLSAYAVDGGGTVATVVDLRRPPVQDGAIVDP